MSALANEYVGVISAMNFNEMTPRQYIEDREHPEKEETLRMFDSL